MLDTCHSVPCARLIIHYTQSGYGLYRQNQRTLFAATTMMAGFRFPNFFISSSQFLSAVKEDLLATSYTMIAYQHHNMFQKQ